MTGRDSGQYANRSPDRVRDSKLDALQVSGGKIAALVRAVPGKRKHAILAPRNAILGR